MKKLFFASILFVLSVMSPCTSMGQVGISVSIGLPPPIFFPEPPVVVALPDTFYVYAVPGIDIDLFFWNGWWWRPWRGRWYRSRYYDRGWAYYGYVPSFYYDVDPGWRGYYRDRSWRGHPWYYERIDYHRLNRNWYRWRNNRHWEREQTWGVQNYRPRPQPQRQELRRERQREYEQRPEVQQYQRERQQQQRQQQRRPQVQEQRQQPRERTGTQRQEQRPQVQQPRQEPRQRGPEPQRQDRPQAQERRQEPPGKVYEPQRQQQPREKPEGGRGESQNRRDDDRK